MSSALDKRLRALEAKERPSSTADERLLPAVVPASATDAEVERLKQRGRLVFRDDDDSFLDIFV